MVALTNQAVGGSTPSGRAINTKDYLTPVGLFSCWGIHQDIQNFSRCAAGTTVIYMENYNKITVAPVSKAHRIYTLNHDAVHFTRPIAG